MAGEAPTVIEESIAAETGIDAADIPEAPTPLALPGAMPSFLKWGLGWSAIGVSALSVVFVTWLSNLAQKASGWLSIFGISTAKAIQHGQQILTNLLGQQYEKVDGELGHAFHLLAKEARLMGKVAVDSGLVALKATQLIAQMAPRPNLAPRIERIRVQVKGNTAQQEQTRVKVEHITKIVAAPTNAPTIRHIHQLQEEVQRQAEEIAQLQKQAQHTSAPSTLAQAIPVVALGLAGLGLNTARCEGTRAMNDALCEAGPQGLSRLINLLGLGLLFIGLVPLAEAEQKVIQEVGTLVHDFWRV